MSSIDWTFQLHEQADWIWREQTRPRLAGLTDEEYFWEPVPGCWSIRPRGKTTAPITGGTGDHQIEFAIPEPDPAPVTTIAWRLGHVIVGVLGMRNRNHFGGPKMDYYEFDYASTAKAALEQLDEAYAGWSAGVRGLDADALAAPCGQAEAPFDDEPMAMLVLHINREVIHHCAEVALLRDLYRARA